jgi:hypothetical protein
VTVRYVAGGWGWGGGWNLTFSPMHLGGGLVMFKFMFSAQARQKKRFCVHVKSIVQFLILERISKNIIISYNDINLLRLGILTSTFKGIGQ